MRFAPLLSLPTIGVLVFAAELFAWGAEPNQEAAPQNQSERGSASPEDLEFFEKKIRPVLMEHCSECHSATAAKANRLKGGLLIDSRDGLRKGGDSGPAIVPGDPEESLLLDALRYESFRMPPKGQLPAATIADFETWIKRGAADPRSEPTRAASRSGMSIEAGREFWCYRPIQKTPPPLRPNSTTDARSPIDAWIGATLAEHDLRPVPEASRMALVRRLYFDLVGLPPSPDDVDEFVADESPEAYERLVERLLASPHFGERWGRHWLDVARFAESLTLRGFVQPEAWRYRDYVIESFNADRPFDRFVREQLAGDLLPADSLAESRRQRVATTYLTLGNTNLEDQDKNQLRMDVVDEQLEAICRGFLAQTVGCARCHDHKFDPIPTRDYYALAGILRNAKAMEHANVSKWLEFPLPLEPEQEAFHKRREETIAAAQSRIKSLKESQMLLAGGRDAAAKSADVALKDLPGIVVDDSQAKLVGEWKHSQHTRPYVGDGYLHDLNAGKGEKTATFLPELPAAGIYEVRLAYTPGSNRSESVPVTIFSADGEKTIRVNQREAPQIDRRFISLGQYRFEQNGQGFVIVSNAETQGHVILDAVQFIPADEVAGAPARITSKTPEPSPVDSEAARKLEAEIRAAETELKRAKESGPNRPLYMSVAEEAEIGDTHVHIRGTVHNLGERVPRGFMQVATLGPAPAISSGQSGRKELAEWIGSKENPLTARVFANRVWHWLFGAGLVRTTDNFGTTGEKPHNPELLDHLASRFVEQGWSVKSLVREVVLSQAYRRASVSDPQNAGIDPENRWLWRSNRRRLDAECLLDAILVVSGDMVDAVGGNVVPKDLAADYGFRHESHRRAVYWPVFRNALPELFEAFDFADPSTVTGVRNASNVAPQALFLLNNPWIVAQSRRAAARILREPHADDAARVRRMFRLALARLPTDIENRAALDHLGPAKLDERGKRFAEFIQAVFASLDFRYVE